MEDASPRTSLPDDVNELKRLLVARDQVIAEHQNTIATLTQQRDEYYLEKLRLEVRLAKALKQAYGPRADRLGDPGQLLLDFGGQLDALVINAADLPVAPDEGAPQEHAASRRLRTRGRRDLSTLDHLPLIEQTYELADELCQCPTCQNQREKIGTAISYTIEYLPGSFVRVKHVQHKYACRACEQDGYNPNITLATKTHGSPIDKGLPGPGLLAYVVTAKFADFRVPRAQRKATWPEVVRNCMRDEGWPLGTGLQEQVSNRLKLRGLRARVVSVEEKARETCQVWSKETSASEPLLKCRNESHRRQNRDLVVGPGSVPAKPAYGWCGVRHEGGVTLVQALVRNVGTCRPDAKGAAQMEAP